MRVRRTMVRHLVAAVSMSAVAFAVQIPSSDMATAAPGDQWLTDVNTYRAMSALAPLTENTTWSADGQAHSCYMLFNGITHDEIVGNLGYTLGGDSAGNNGNIAVSSNAAATARDHIDIWMSGPFHAIGILRPELATTGFGICANAATTPWHSGATLDVIRGIDPQRANPTTATVFPGRGATIALNQFRTESPDPVALCNWTGSAGLPLIAMMPGGVTSASASLVGPGGSIETCVLHGGNTAADDTAQSILNGDNAVVVVPRAPLVPGAYTSTVTSTGGDVTWSFRAQPGDRRRYDTRGWSGRDTPGSSGHPRGPLHERRCPPHRRHQRRVVLTETVVSTCRQRRIIGSSTDAR